MNGYIGYYKNKQYEVYADTSYQAQRKLATQLKVKKAYEITIMLAEKNGTPVTHTASF